MKNLLILFLIVFTNSLCAQQDQCAKCQECLPLAKEVQKNASEYEQIKTAIGATSDPDQKSQLNARMNNNRNKARQLQDKLTATGCWGYVKFKNCNNFCKDQQQQNDTPQQNDDSYSQEQKDSKQKTDLQKEFEDEIAKINQTITIINKYAKNRNLREAFLIAKILSDDLRIKIGNGYFYETLMQIRKDNPNYSFSIEPLSEEMSREYWIRMRNRANIAYRNAIDAQNGLVYNEGIQQAQKVMIPLRFIKTTYDLFSGLNGIFPKDFFGTLQKIKDGLVSKDGLEKLVVSGNVIKLQRITKTEKLAEIISDEALGANESALDWKSYVGLLGSLASAYDGYMKVYNGLKEYQTQAGLIECNRQSAEDLINSSRNLILQFDRYRAYMDAHLYIIDRLKDQLSRIKMDNLIAQKNNEIKTVWGNNEFYWDVEEYEKQIRECGEDLKEGYIYYEDFVKNVQFILQQANKDLQRIQEKVKQSGVSQNEINAQLSYNNENADWLDKEVEKLLAQYLPYGDTEENRHPEDVIAVSYQVVPGEEYKNTDPDQPDPWEVEDPADQNNEYEKSDPGNETANDTPSGNYNSPSGNTTSGNGWSIKQIQSTPDVIQNELTAETNAGRTPAGIYINDHSGAQVYYINDDPLGMTAWSLEWYNDATSLQNGINDYINNGYLPMGISFSDQGKLYVLYILCQVKGNAWQLVESELDLNSVSQNLQPLINQNYVPVGITVYENMYYTLMVQVSDAQMSNWTIEGYEWENKKQNVNAKINQGLVPFGYLKEGNIVNVLYVGF